MLRLKIKVKEKGGKNHQFTFAGRLATTKREAVPNERNDFSGSSLMERRSPWQADVLTEKKIKSCLVNFGATFNSDSERCIDIFLYRNGRWH